MNKQQEILKLVYEKDNGRKYISIPNSRLDFEAEFLFLGFTPSGRPKLGDVFGFKDGEPQYSVKFGTIEDRDNGNGFVLAVNNWSYIKRFKKEGITP